MDSWEFNKIAAAVLAALLLLVGARTAIDMSQAAHGHAVVGYALPVDAKAATGGGGAAPAAFSFAKVAQLLPKASADAGAAAFKKCAACHTVDKGGASRTGPNLYGIVNRGKGAVDGFSYSQSVKTKGGDWSFEAIAGFLHDPKGYIPGNKMGFAGVKDDQELADILIYLRSLSPSPAPLPQG
ncbi:MAG: c-type cytochrome [Hyphomicrobiaceae bacterium]